MTKYINRTDGVVQFLNYFIGPGEVRDIRPEVEHLINKRGVRLEKIDWITLDADPAIDMSMRINAALDGYQDLTDVKVHLVSKYPPEITVISPPNNVKPKTKKRK